MSVGNRKYLLNQQTLTRFLLLILYEVKNDGIFNNNRNGQLSTVGRYMRLKLVQSFKDGKEPVKKSL